MSEKIIENFLYHGFGFPVELKDVAMKKIDGEFHPIIDIKKVAAQAIQNLMTQESQLTGNQLNFIRTYLKMSTSEFTQLTNIAEIDIKKWENFADKPINMNPKVENSLKQHIQNQLFINKKNEEKEKTPTQSIASKGIFSSSREQSSNPSPTSSDKESEQKIKIPKKK